MKDENNSKTTNDFYELSEETLGVIKDLLDNMALPFNIKILYLGSPKQKCLVKLKVASKEFQYKNHIDMILYINEDYFIRLEAKNAEILLYQELDRLAFNIEKGTFKIAKYQLQTTSGVLKKYGIDAVANANELSELFTKQKKDSDTDTSTMPQIGFDTGAKKAKKNVEFLK